MTRTEPGRPLQHHSDNMQHCSTASHLPILSPVSLQDGVSPLNEGAAGVFTLRNPHVILGLEIPAARVEEIVITLSGSLDIIVRCRL